MGNYSKNSMQNDKYTYYAQWHALTKDLADQVRLEVFDAINAYIFDGVENPLTPHGQGVFASIRLQIDADARRAANIRAKRAAAGRAHKGNQYGVKMEQVFQNGTSVPNQLTASELVGIAPKMEQNGTNGTSVPNSLIISGNGTNGTSVPNFPPIPPFNNITTTTTTTASAYARMREWMADNPETLMILCGCNKLITEAKPAEELMQILDQYIRTFIEAEAVRDAIARNDRTGVKAHFERWLPKYLKATKDEDATTKRGSTSRTKPVAQDADYWDV